ncbi:hypothetical protein TNIN_152121 [Trichonephila inaurata madagascariensis]|uniref:Uncharacterized protein n=1 Tax=Trichonephila inaurata madagascariensis TaxID=2747483 RepID=A0A8X7BU93_9ARAC|nr:hypothetical protein TNIN_152121 [Trichonephila inaurata madagascariensis]
MQPCCSPWVGIPVFSHFPERILRLGEEYVGYSSDESGKKDLDYEILSIGPITLHFEDVNDLSPLTPTMFYKIETSDVTARDCLDHPKGESARGLGNFKPFGNNRKRFRVRVIQLIPGKMMDTWGWLEVKTGHRELVRPKLPKETLQSRTALQNQNLDFTYQDLTDSVIHFAGESRKVTSRSV